MIKTLITATLEKAINRYLNLDQEIYARITALPSKVILLAVPEWKIQFYLMPTAQGIKLFGDYSGEVATTIQGKLLSMLALSQTKEHDSKLFSEVSIEGDVEFGQTFRELLQQVNIDWEEPLAKWLGDSMAHKIGNAIRELLSWQQRTTQHFKEDLRDYLQLETNQLPAAQELEDFYEGVSELRHDVARLEARFEQLQPKAKEH